VVLTVDNVLVAVVTANLQALADMQETAVYFRSCICLIFSP